MRRRASKDGPAGSQHLAAAPTCSRRSSRASSSAGVGSAVAGGRSSSGAAAAAAVGAGRHCPRRRSELPLRRVGLQFIVHKYDSVNRYEGERRWQKTTTDTACRLPTGRGAGAPWRHHGAQHDGQGQSAPTIPATSVWLAGRGTDGSATATGWSLMQGRRCAERRASKLPIRGPIPLCPCWVLCSAGGSSATFSPELFPIACMT